MHVFQRLSLYCLVKKACCQGQVFNGRNMLHFRYRDITVWLPKSVKSELHTGEAHGGNEFDAFVLSMFGSKL
jgi:hypothetical protein